MGPDRSHFPATNGLRPFSYWSRTMSAWATNILFAATTAKPLNGLSDDFWTYFWISSPLILLLLGALAWEAMGIRYIPNNRVGVVEKLWSKKGSVTEGH